MPSTITNTHPDNPSSWVEVTARKRARSSLKGVAAATATSLEGALTRPSFVCSKCSEPVIPAAQGHQYDYCLGDIDRLPVLKTIPATSVVHDPTSGVDGGAGHLPCVITMLSACGHIVLGLRWKYPNLPLGHDILEQYVPLDTTGVEHTHSKGVLPYDGPRMNSGSCVKLEFGYWIGWDHLERWNGGGTKLCPESLARLKLYYAEAEIHRQRYGSRSVERLARSRTPPTSPPATPSPSPPSTPPSSPQGGLPTPPPSPPSRKRPHSGRQSPSPAKKAAMAGSWR